MGLSTIAVYNTNIGSVPSSGVKSISTAWPRFISARVWWMQEELAPHW
jgi:hypothetical protein